jgi:hypothetical protein
MRGRASLSAMGKQYNKGKHYAMTRRSGSLPVALFVGLVKRCATSNDADLIFHLIQCLFCLALSVFYITSHRISVSLHCINRELLLQDLIIRFSLAAFGPFQQTLACIFVDPSCDYYRRHDCRRQE